MLHKEYTEESFNVLRMLGLPSASGFIEELIETVKLTGDVKVAGEIWFISYAFIHMW